MVTAKKRFGQNFLTDPKKADRLIDALRIEKGETILEIGPGTGMLTERILARGANLVAVELDRELLPALQERFGGNDRFKLVEDDIINVTPLSVTSTGLKVIGNLPYNISGAVVDWLIDNFDDIKLAVITVQKEVADRLKADHGSRDYGALSVLVQSFYEISRLFNIPPGCFAPKPKVNSSALILKPRKRLDDDIFYPRFKEFVRACFYQKRKKLTNSLAASTGIGKTIIEEQLTALGKTANCRAEELALTEFYELYRLIG